LGTIAGGVTFFVLGFLLWGVAFAGVFEANALSAGIMKDPPDFVHLGIGQLGFGALLTLIFGKWANISTAMTGLMAGAQIGILMAIGVDLSFFGTMNIMNITGTFIDIALVTVQTAIGGAVVGAVLGMTKES
jgi:hypothetical protein